MNIQNILDKENILGKPYFKYGDEVGFNLIPYKETKEKFFTGKVYIIDAYGTFEQNEEPSYDIMVEAYDGTASTVLSTIKSFVAGRLRSQQSSKSSCRFFASAVGSNPTCGKTVYFLPITAKFSIFA